MANLMILWANKAMDIHLHTVTLNKPYENEVALRDQKIPLKCHQPLDF